MSAAKHAGPAFPSTPLLRCPFCGSVARWYRAGRSIGVECSGADVSDCNAQTDTFDPENGDAAAGLWNRRHDVQADSIGRLLGVVRRLRDQVDSDGDALTQQQHEELIQETDRAISYACFADGQPQPSEVRHG